MEKHNNQSYADYACYITFGQETFQWKPSLEIAGDLKVSRRFPLPKIEDS